MAFSANNLPFFVLTTSGLEATSVKELTMLPHVSINTVTYRRVLGTYSGSLVELCSLRTVDDVFLEIVTWTDIGRPRSCLGRLRHLGASLDLHAAAAYCAHFRPVYMPPTFSMTVSFVGKRNYTSEEIKAVLASAIESTHRGWTFQHDDRAADLNVRVFLEHEMATIGVRVGKTALHDRWYQRVHLPGALKPSVAAALVLLAQTSTTTHVLDPCCGSGTILIEAALQGAIVCGGDSNPVAVAATRANLAAAGVKASVRQWDATSLPIADAAVDRVITNLPWGRQVQVQEPLPSLHQRMFTQMRRVLAPLGRLVLLTNAPEEIDPLDLACVEQIKISLFGQHPTILIFSSRHTSR